MKLVKDIISDKLDSIFDRTAFHNDVNVDYKIGFTIEGSQVVSYFNEFDDEMFNIKMFIKYDLEEMYTSGTHGVYTNVS